MGDIGAANCATDGNAMSKVLKLTFTFSKMSSPEFAASNCCHAIAVAGISSALRRASRPNVPMKLQHRRTWTLRVEGHNRRIYRNSDILITACSSYGYAHLLFAAVTVLSGNPHTQTLASAPNCTASRKRCSRDQCRDHRDGGQTAWS